MFHTSMILQAVPISLKCRESLSGGSLFCVENSKNKE